MQSNHWHIPHSSPHTTHPNSILPNANQPTPNPIHFLQERLRQLRPSHPAPSACPLLRPHLRPALQHPPTPGSSSPATPTRAPARTTIGNPLMNNHFFYACQGAIKIMRDKDLTDTEIGLVLNTAYLAATTQEFSRLVELLKSSPSPFEGWCHFRDQVTFRRLEQDNAS